MRALITAVMTVVTVLGICSACAALPYSMEVTAAPNGAGSDSWTYIVNNTSTGSFDLWMFAIEFDSNTNVLNVVTPAGWKADTESQEHVVTWMRRSGGLAAGAKQFGFQVQISGPTTYQNWSALFNNAETDEWPVTEGIVQLPEPAGAAILAAGLAPMMAFLLRKRKAG